MSSLRPFHLAIPVDDLEAARAFYSGVLGCREGRSDTHWVDFDFFGHQLVCHLRSPRVDEALYNEVDGKRVPVPHFGVVLTMDDWQRLAARLAGHDQVFGIEPYIRFAGQTGEQGTFFLLDPSGNALEFKGFADLDALFAT